MRDRLTAPGRIGLRLRAALTRPARLRPPIAPSDAGRAERGHRLAAGEFLWRGSAVTAPDAAIWQVPIADPDFARAIHGFDWLDDLAAAGSEAAEARARDWTGRWLDGFGGGQGPGWAPATVGARLRRWIDHADLLTTDEPVRDRRFARALAAQAGWLGRHWRAAPQGPERLEALTGLILASLALRGRSPEPALRGLEETIAATLDPGVPGRTPEALAHTFARLARIRHDLAEAGRPVPDGLAGALAAAAPVLRTLRHADGGLARFHGGGRGVPGALDRALALSGIPSAPGGDRAMGYARLAHGRSTVIVDAAAPPGGAAATEAHASTLAFELTSGRRPLVVSCGAGRSFGDRWRRAGRATPSHSTLTLDGTSSARLEGAGGTGALRDGPRDVRVERRVTALASGLIAGHDGYVASHGLTHIRHLHLSRDGRALSGEDVIATVERADEAACDRALDAAGGRIPFRIRFHLHPGVAARIATPGQPVELTLPSGEVWTFEQSGGARVTLERSVHLSEAAARPIPAQQIVVAGAATDYATRVTWTLAKAAETPDAVRDLVQDDRPVPV